MLLYFQRILIYALVLLIYKCSQYRYNSKVDFSYSGKTLFPYGSYSQETKTEMIVYLKELMGKLLFIDKSLDVDRILQDWFTKMNYPVLQTVDKEIQYQSTIDILKQTIYPIQTQHRELVPLLDEMSNKIPKCLICNDYIQVRELLTMLKQIR